MNTLKSKPSEVLSYLTNVVNNPVTQEETNLSVSKVRLPMTFNLNLALKLLLPPTSPNKRWGLHTILH